MSITMLDRFLANGVAIEWVPDDQLQRKKAQKIGWRSKTYGLV
jgi:hypothetical protein